MKKFTKKYEDIITSENLIYAWKAFLVGKKKKKDVILFQTRLIDNLFNLLDDLRNKTHVHGGYKSFNISDPKPRIIHKATVRDRLLHHLIYQELYSFFDTKFVYDSYSCRVNKGTHKALYRFESMVLKVSKNNTKTCWILKCDIRKFFANIDHQILKDILKKHIEDRDILWLFGRVIDSFQIEGRSVGLPLGNLTSQLLVNIYMNEFDQFVKHKLKAKYYIRYADDFVLIDDNKDKLLELIPKIEKFLNEKLKLSLHSKKLFTKTLASGVDFLGWIQFPHHRMIRTSTKRRMIKQINFCPKEETITSYLGMLKHGDTYILQSSIRRSYTTKNPSDP